MKDSPASEVEINSDIEPNQSDINGGGKLQTSLLRMLLSQHQKPKPAEDDEEFMKILQ